MTIDGSQGREWSLVFFILGVTFGSGPGFLTDEQRLSVAATRGIAGMVWVGESGMLGQLDRRDPEKGKVRIEVGLGDDKKTVTATLLWDMLKCFKDNRRVIRSGL